MTDSHPPKSRLRWYQFRLRTLLVSVLLVAVACSWLAVKTQRARRQARIVQAIRAREGWVRYDYEVDADRQRLQAPKVPAPAWLVRLLGVDFFADVVAVGSLRMDDDDLKNLEGLTNLNTLALHLTPVTDAGLEHLQGLTNLEELDLQGTRVTDAGLEHLQRLTKLKSLNLHGTQVIDVGLKHLKGLTNLERLNLDGTQVTDAGLEHLQGLTNLQSLFLRRTHVTDTGLEHLKGLTNLERLSLWATKVSEEGVKKLQRALPNCRISLRF